MIRIKKRKDAWENAAEEKIRLLEHQLRRTQDTAVSLENVAAKYRDEVEKYREENDELKDLVQSLRWRIFSLLQSTEEDAEIFGLPQYRLDMEREYDDEETAEGIFEELNKLSNKYHVKTEVVSAEYEGEEDVGL